MLSDIQRKLSQQFRIFNENDRIAGQPTFMINDKCRLKSTRDFTGIEYLAY